MFFNTYNSPNGFGKEDIFVSKKTANGWSKPVNLGGLINTNANEGSPKFSSNGKYFFFSRENLKAGEEDGIWSILYVETAALKLETLFAQEKIVRADEVTDDLFNIKLKSNGQIFTGKVVQYFPDGRPKLWREVKDGFADGLWMEWLENGNLRYRAYWKKGKGDGLWQYFHDNGKLRSEGFYSEDLAEGVHYEWHDNGQLRVKRIYRNNKQNGVLTFYLPSGEVEKVEVYQDGKKIVQ
jgi:antitoxin component YwqK of YwqJK toxin-antitoxin module